jgi:hypothetical protein
MLNFANDEDLVKFVLLAVLPAWQKKLFENHSNAIKVHSQGWLFYKIDRLFPNESPESKRQRVLSFESITEASFGRAANNVNRIFKNSSYTVEASEKTVNELSQHKFDGLNFYTWFLDEWTKFALKEDPNARIVVYPPEYVTRYNRPPVCFIESQFIRLISDDAVIFISEEESKVEYNLQEYRSIDVPFWDQSIDRPNIMTARENTYSPKIIATIKKYVYHIFLNGQGFYRMEQLTNGMNEWELEFFPIKKEFIPVIDVGGDQGKLGINKSFLHPFVPFGNLALLQHSQHTAVNFIFSFPRMSEVETPCDTPGCSAGRIECDITDEFPEGWKACRNCGGTGFKTPQSPYKIYKKRIDPNGMEGDNAYLKVPDVQYYTPETAILDYSKKEWKDYLEQAETAVYIQQRIKTGNVEAAKSKEIDRDDLYSFLSRVGQTFFSRMRFTVQCFENYLVANPSQVSIDNPYSYAILSEGEAFDALSKILESSVPVMMKANQVESFINKFVSASSPIRKFLDVLSYVDPLLFYSAADLLNYKIGGVISSDQLSVHVYSFPALQKMYFEDPNLFLQDVAAIAAKLETALQDYKPKPATDLRTTLLNSNTPPNNNNAQ